MDLCANMPRVVDCLSAETVFRDDSIAVCEKECERLGGNKRGYYVFPDEMGLTENIKESKIVSMEPAIGELFG